METSRREKFEILREHPWLGKIFRKLTLADMKLCIEFLNLHESKTIDEFEFLVNRMFLDKSDRPKNSGIIQELLSCANKIPN